MTPVTRFIKNEVFKKLDEIKVSHKKNESLNNLQKKLEDNLTPREFDDFMWDLNISVLDHNGVWED
jgi:hypothetical protein